MPATIKIDERFCHNVSDNPTGGRSLQPEQTSKMSEKGTIAMSLVHETLARAHGFDVAPIVEAAGLAASALDAPHARVSAAQYGAIWSGVARALDDEFLGQDSHAMKSGSFIAMTHAALGAHTGRQALQRAVHFMRLVLDDLAAEIDIDAMRVRIAFRQRAGTPVPAMFAYATWFILVYGLLCWLVGRRIPVIAARFRCPAPPDTPEYQLMICEDMSFDQPESWFDLAPAFLDLPVIQTAASARAFLRNAPGNFVVKYRNPGSFAARVRRALRALPANAWPDADAIAQRLNVAPATLRRRLHQEGHSCQSIKDELRRDLALEALLDPARSVADVAAAVGFAEPSAFHRAFRKWTGRRPAEYRRMRERPASKAR
ncbi:AraC family transcriptional regulator [Paraburkholderia silviterrae]|uniref:AraC family transcriptional regulator n=2 Tax=Paraburkholderia silviterrae TaxID=2528715 RepID=A0A4V2ZZV2_9BURK|nr:AraC family transcriptional regulator [Paraburkholderia silviterrae]